MISSSIFFIIKTKTFAVCSCLKVLNDGSNSLVYAEIGQYSVLIKQILDLSLICSGRDISLSCVYDLEDDVLYSIKWYRDDKEFYRYLPNIG